MLALGAAAAGWLVARAAAPATVALLLLPFTLGFLGVLQARAQTCVGLAARGLHTDDSGAVSALPTELDRQVRRQASRVWRGATIGGVTLTAIVVLLAVIRRAGT